MKRRLLNLLTVLSLLPCVAVAVLGVRSLWRADIYSHAGDARCWTFVSDRGLVRVTLYEDENTRLHGWVGGSIRTGPGQNGLWRELVLCDPAWPRLGMGFKESRTDVDNHWRHGNRRYRSWIFPYWLLAIMTGPPALSMLARRVRRARARRRSARGLCPACSYDLRATPGQCPECGHTPVGTET